jgi:uncharacterized repeat protein (TIGR01451 family)
MWHLPNISLRIASAIAVLALIPAWKSGSILNSASQAQSPTSVPTLDVSKALNAKGDAASAARLSASYGKLPISFEVNQGQTDRSVQFLARGAGYTLFLTPGEAVLSLHAPPANASKPGGLAVPHALPSSPAKLASTNPPSTVRLQLIGANTAAKAEGVDPLPGKSNYFVGNDPAKWHTDVPTYAKVRYTNVYPGIDLLYYGNQEGRLEHDFVVAPGADPNAITIGLRDSDGAVPDQLGGLTLHTKSGSLTLRSPTVYQDIGGQRKTIPATYLLANNQIKFQLGSYDRNVPLVIDPVLQYTAAWGGTNYEIAEDMAVDNSGNVYVTGLTESIDFPLRTPFQKSWDNSGSTATGFVSKINAAGTALVYSTYVGVMYNRIAVDSAGRAYVTGRSTSDLPVKNAYQPNRNGVDAYLMVLVPAGDALVYATYLGGPDADAPRAIALDVSGNVYVTGISGKDFPTLHSIQPQGVIFVAKFNSTGVLQYSSVFAPSLAYPLALAVDASGSAYITGEVLSPDFPARKPAFRFTCPRCPEPSGFVAKLGPTGDSLVYSTYLGGASASYGNAIAVDSSGNAYIGGLTGPGFPVSSTAFQKTEGGGSDGYVAKLNSSGSGLIWSTYLGGSGNDDIMGLVLDRYRQVYVTGNTDSPNFPLKAPVQNFVRGVTEQPRQIFVTTLSGSLSSVVYYSTYFGAGSLYNNSVSIAVDQALNVYIGGVVTGGEIQVTPGALHTSTSANPSSNWDSFVSKLVIMDDLALGVSASSGTVAHGSNLTYTIGVTSRGPDVGLSVRIDDPLPVGTTFVSYNAGGGTCTAPAVGAIGTLHCSLPKLEKGGTYTVTLTVKANAVAGTTLSNTATTVSNMQDFVPSNNKGTLTTMVN